MIYALLAIAVVLTFTMFHTRQMMLGFPCVIFWAILGGHAYTLSTATWDVYYFLFFASAFGMTVFCAMAMYGLRESKDTLEEEEKYIDEEKDTSRYIDENQSNKGESDEPKMSERTKGLRDRAEKRRVGGKKRMKL